MSRTLRMPSLQELPEGPRRRFVEELFEYYRAAKRPDLRFLSETIANDETLRGMPGRETIRRMLTGKVVPPRWETAEALFLTLCRLAGRDPKGMREPYQEGARYQDEYDQTTCAEAFEMAWHEALDAAPAVPQVPDVPAPSLASAFPEDEPPF